MAMAAPGTNLGFDKLCEALRTTRMSLFCLTGDTGDGSLVPQWQQDELNTISSEGALPDTAAYED